MNAVQTYRLIEKCKEIADKNGMEITLLADTGMFTIYTKEDNQIPNDYKYVNAYSNPNELKAFLDGVDYNETRKK